ncbi:YbaB/EbfC family nucleoid-associated protein [Ahniella affigens]|uniref:Nucleoid-associated protein C7S18_18015 n=1 Tax=Ahniella affigens TaxID=2021234 RepID=A0A2P1PW00_9GAMM|nr:YbaB/EbfC family nucleoid-associated protein [Ahniella affigens]AVP98954.1 YbaB/EbfC family nucleoid-associated protein [Ahniella affigens]
MRGPLGNIMQQAQKMQDNLKRAQEEVARLEVTGQAGGGMVQIVMNGAHEVKRVKIDKAVVGDDIEMLEDLITAATNDAVNKIAEQSKARMAEVTQGMSLPAGFKLPF